MIQNLNGVTFYKYGHVNTPSCISSTTFLSPNDWTKETYSISSTKLLHLHRCKEFPVWLDIIEGIALLCVSLTLQTDEAQVFLLDKPVSVTPGVFFNIVPLHGTCSISMAYQSKEPLEIFNLSHEMVPSVINPKFSIQKIHTLFYQEKETGFRFRGEEHSFWELTYVDQGVLKTKIEDPIYCLNQGDFIFYTPHQYHQQWAEGDTSVCFVTITFDMDFEEQHLLKNHVFHGNTEMKYLLNQILQEKNRDTYYSDDLILCYVKELIIKLIRDIRFESTIDRLSTDMQVNVENTIVSQALEYIHSHIHLKLTVSEIANIIPISSSYLSTLFKKNTGTTVMEYVNQYRLKKSKEYLRNSTYTITQIAELLGYSSVHYFSKQFKDYYGVAPTVYARSIQH
ncbi:MAG: AraC family transcriptional regulator [Epulopiscium sp.]|nr:AraC family transcriptional regulator [Candidatus Epulonipiscium sp.]